MDREQEELQFIGLFGIYKESFKIIISWRQIFSKITLTLILPLTFIFLAHIEVSNLLFRNILRTEFEKDMSLPGTRSYTRLSDALTSERIEYWLFKAAYFTFLLAFSLLSTAAVVYTVACIYTGRDLTYKKVMSVVPTVWKRLMVTFLCIFLAYFVYLSLAVLIAVIFSYVIPDDNTFGDVMSVIVVVFLLLGFVVMTIIWQLACVVTVLESSYGFKAMRKSIDLIRGKWWVASVIFLKLNVSFFAVQTGFNMLVVHGRWFGLDMWERAGLGILFFLLLFKVFLFGLVIQTVLYFVCKSYHHENIDKSSLSQHLEGYAGEYEPLKGMDVQLQEYHV